MKKLLLLALMAGLVFGECEVENTKDEMTDVVQKIFSCYNTSEERGGALMMKADSQGKPDFETLTVASQKGFGFRVRFMNMFVMVRLDSNPAFEKSLGSFDGQSFEMGRLYPLLKSEVEQFKKANRFLMKYDGLLGTVEMMEIDISGLHKFY